MLQSYQGRKEMMKKYIGIVLAALVLLGVGVFVIHKKGYLKLPHNSSIETKNNKLA